MRDERTNERRPVFRVASALDRGDRTRGSPMSVDREPRVPEREGGGGSVNLGSMFY